jgi:hypothetical protein
MTAESWRVNTKAALFCCAAGDAKLETNPLGRELSPPTQLTQEKKPKQLLRLLVALQALQ